MDQTSGEEEIRTDWANALEVGGDTEKNHRMKEVKVNVSIICQMYRQKDCRGFIEWKNPGECIYGLPDRPCGNFSLCQNALVEWFCGWREEELRGDEDADNE